MANDELKMRRFRGVLTGLIGCLTVAFIVFSTRSVTDGKNLFEKESKESTNFIEDASQPYEMSSNKIQVGTEFNIFCKQFLKQQCFNL